MNRSAIISDCGRYRYRLGRSWYGNIDFGNIEPVRRIVWVMLNPSTADHMTDDRTIERCVDFSRSWGFNDMTVVNLFAYRATDPRDLRIPADPVGPLNGWHVQDATRSAERIVCAWGSHRFVTAALEAKMVRDIGRPVECLGTTRSGSPRHPLYLRKTTQPIEFKTRQHPRPV